ncbi:MAG: Hpt domain-containing protein, partial [Alphaproteobacteria bacterium]
MLGMREEAWDFTRNSGGNEDDEIILRLRQEFLDDSQDRTESLDRALAELRAGTGSEEDAVTCLRREAHNLKGTGAAFGFPIVTLIAHRLEDYLADAAGLGARQIEDTQKFVDALQTALESGASPGQAECDLLLRSLPAKWSPEA